MPTALPENVQASDVGHINHTNDMHEFRNSVVSVGRSVIYVDPTNGSDSNDGFSLAYAKQTVAGALAAASNGYEIRFMEGDYNISSQVTANNLKGVRLLGAGGISRDATYGTRFKAKTDSMTMIQFEAENDIQKEGPEFVGIDFVNDSPTVRSVLLLSLRGVNRWRIERCSFIDADRGIDLSSSVIGSTANDNAWNEITGTHFTHNNIGIAASGAGTRFLGCEFTGNRDFAADLDGQNHKFLGSFFDRSPVTLQSNHTMFVACKFEGGNHNDAGGHVINIRSNDMGSSGYGNQNGVLFCAFSGFGGTSDPPDASHAYINIETGARFTQVIGNQWVNSGTRIIDNGLLTMKWNPQEVETYSLSNVSTSRSFDANSVTLDGLADVVGTLIDDLHAIGILEQ